MHVAAGSQARVHVWLQAVARACSKLGGTRCLSQGSLEIQSRTVVSHTCASEGATPHARPCADGGTAAHCGDLL